MENKEKKELLVMRIDKDLKDRLEKLSNKRKTTITSLTNDAIKKFLDREEYTFEDLLELVDANSSLRINKEKIIEEMKKCPPIMCKQIMDIIRNKQVFLFEETLDSAAKRIEDIDKNDLYGIYLHITSRDQDMNKVNEIIKKISEILKDKKINIGAGIKGNNHDKILIFVSYNKKESEK